MRTQAACAVAMVLIAGFGTACEGDATDPGAEPTGASGESVELEFLAYGADDEVAAYESMVQRFNDDNPGVEVRLETAANQDEARRVLASGDVPDVFLASRRDLVGIAEAGINQPLDELLDSRGVDFGDLYKRDALLAFSLDSRLQCMPYGASPMVMYYNTDLVDFEEMAAQELPVSGNPLRWNFDQFAAAAEFAARRGTKGVHIDPTLQGLAPFVYSGGGELFDDPRQPTTLTLTDEATQGALGRTMQLLRRGRITLSPRQLRQESALRRFKDGRLGMIAGFRGLVPELREVEGLSFDVMPMPVLESETTVGDVSGICLAADSASTSAAADFVVHAISAESVAEVTEAGYLVPASNEVAESEAFLQRDRLPAHAEVFNRSVRDIVIPPLLESLPALEKAVHDDLYRLFYARVIAIDEIAAAIDEASRVVIDPEAAAEQDAEQDSESGETPTDESS
ncbi:ABC transporter substrate-binding protein [Nocardioides donggukensis]|uniref:Extracellular solute-binding protein n=1 Tax=Nocardioides donggukensis TaxID=2774019 RepID=A0A927K7P7_9ACTN|nr:extracellular solute-binding protein [Nocardioides donggukensis]MBD8870533.1 extracellular solute-binding protein [Nocardioides donggukensis]